MGAIRSFGLVILGAIAVLIYSTIFIVDEREKALVVRFGEIQRTINEPRLLLQDPRRGRACMD